MQWTLPITKPKGTEIFFHRRQITFNMGTWSLDTLDFRSVGLHKSFPCKANFHYAWISFKRGFNVLNMERKFCEGQIIIVPIHILFTWHPFGDCSRQRRKSENVNVKCTPVQAVRFCTGHMAYRGSRGMALPFLDQGTRRGWGVSVTLQPFEEGKTIKNSSIMAEISIPLTHWSIDLLQKKFLGLQSELLHHLSDFI